MMFPIEQNYLMALPLFNGKPDDGVGENERRRSDCLHQKSLWAVHRKEELWVVTVWDNF